MNYAKDETPAEMVLRKLACWLGVGSYNAPSVDAKVFHRKIVAGVEMLVAECRAAQPVVAEEKPERLHTFLDAAAGVGLVLDGVDAAVLYIELFPERYAAAKV